MKKVNVLILIILASFMLCCSSEKNTENKLPCIDIKKNYPEKEIILTDIADVTYVHLNTDDDDYLHKSCYTQITESKIVVCDLYSGSILFFLKDGTPKSRFNRYGAGSEEYISKKNDMCFYDEPADEVFVGNSGNRIIQVYSSTGKYKRTLTLRQGAQPYQIVEFDNQSFVVFDAGLMWEKSFSGSNFILQAIDSSYYRISKTDGEIVEYIELPGNEIDLSVEGNLKGNKINNIPTNKRLTKCAAGLFFCNLESDTVFRCNKNTSLTPVFCKSPLVSNLEKKIILSNYIEIGKYQYMSIETHLGLLEMRGNWMESFKFYMRDKQTGEIFQQKIVLPDYNGHHFVISSLYNTTYNEKETLLCYRLNLFDLKQAYEDNKLGGKLKELVATLDDMNDNDVLMFVLFR